MQLDVCQVLKHGIKCGRNGGHPGLEWPLFFSEVHFAVLLRPLVCFYNERPDGKHFAFLLACHILRLSLFAVLAVYVQYIYIRMCYIQYDIIIM